jgi:RNA recognition motif-containing protein
MPRDYPRSLSRSPGLLLSSRHRSRSLDRSYHDHNHISVYDYRDRERDREREREEFRYLLSSSGSSSAREREYRSSRSSYDRDDASSDDSENRLHIADLTEQVSQHELEKIFSRYGELKDVWMAKNPPCFAFIVYKNKNDALLALHEMDQR